MGDCESLGESYYIDGVATSNASDFNTFTVGESIAHIGVLAQGDFLGTNDDLNSFFTPDLDGPNKNVVLSNPPEFAQTAGHWGIEDRSQLFAGQQEFPFPMVQLQPYTQQYI
jgi:hypothetical protein